MIVFENSKHGELTAKIDNTYLHSSYSPLKESEKFIKANNLFKFTTFILIEPCLNYTGLILKEHNPRCKILSVYFNEDFFIKDSSVSDHKFLHNGTSDRLVKFFKSYLSAIDLEGLKIVEWSPSATRFYDMITDLKKIIAQIIRELHGNITTTSGFGKKLFKNFIKNYIASNVTAIPDKTNHPILIAGSGPGLKKDIDFISKYRNNFLLLSLPSSLQFLKHAGISPDLIISTDPGYYASLHLAGFENIPLVAPYTAKMTLSNYNNAIIHLKQNYMMENELLNESESYIALPPNGTVAGSAVYFALLLTSSVVLISGLDFSFVDILSHIRPHSFDNYLDKKTNRLNSLSNIYFNRNIPNTERLTGTRRTSLALKTYSGWFAGASDYLHDRCYFLDYYTAPPGSFKNITYSEAESFLSKSAELPLTIGSRISVESRIIAVNNYITNSVSMCKDLIRQSLNTECGFELFKLLFNDFTFNLFLPELLEFKRHYINKNGKDVQNKAVSLIEKSINFLENYINYV